MYLLGVVAALTLLSISIAVHEMGHLIPAKLFGVKVPQFMIGFGPTLWSRRFGETEYGIKAFPLGGYCKLLGMMPPHRETFDGTTASGPPAGRFSGLADDARADSEDELAPEERHRAFYRLSTGKKLTVMAGGIVMNLLLGAVILAGVVGTAGLATGEPSTTVARVIACVDERAANGCDGQEPSPAAAAGLRPGDVIVELAGRPVATWDDIAPALDGQVGKQLPLVVERDGQRVTLQVTPTRRPSFTEPGVVERDASGAMVTTDQAFLAISPEQARSRDISVVPGMVSDITVGTARLIVSLPVTVYDMVRDMIEGEPRSAETPISPVGVGKAAGEVVSGESEMVGDSTKNKIIWLLSVTAMLNISLFVFNLVPLLPMDGGHVAIALWEAVRRPFMRGQARRAYADVARALPFMYPVLGFLAIMTVVLVFADLFHSVQV